MKPFNCDILGIAETHWTGTGELENGKVIWVGEEAVRRKGVGFLLSQRAKKALLGYNPVNSRIISARFQGKPINITVIQVYAPTLDSEEEEIEDFYGKLEETLRGVPRKDVKVILGDWNAKVGTDRT